MMISLLPVIAERHSSTKTTAVTVCPTVMEVYLRDIILSKVSSFTSANSGVIAGGYSKMNLSNKLSIVQDNARGCRSCPLVGNNKLNEDNDDLAKQQQQQRKSTSSNCRWGAESPTKSLTLTSQGSRIKKSSSTMRKMTSPPPASSSSSSVRRWTTDLHVELTKSYALPLGDKVTVQAAVENAISLSSSSSYDFDHPDQCSSDRNRINRSHNRSRWSSSNIALLNASSLSLMDSHSQSQQQIGSSSSLSDQLMRAPKRRISIEGLEKLTCHQKQDQQGLGEQPSQNFKWGTITTSSDTTCTGTTTTTTTTRRNRYARTSLTPARNMTTTTTTASILDEIVRRDKFPNRLYDALYDDIESDDDEEEDD